MNMLTFILGFIPLKPMSGRKVKASSVISVVQMFFSFSFVFHCLFPFQFRFSFCKFFRFSFSFLHFSVSIFVTTNILSQLQSSVYQVLCMVCVLFYSCIANFYFTKN